MSFSATVCSNSAFAEALLDAVRADPLRHPGSRRVQRGHVGEVFFGFAVEESLGTGVRAQERMQAVANCLVVTVFSEQAVAFVGIEVQQLLEQLECAALFPPGHGVSSSA
jgi:hypothetical protein